MFIFIEPEDLAHFATIPEAKAAAMIADAEAKAILAAPKLATTALEPQQLAQVKAILRDAILRWNDRGSGALTQTSVGQVSISTDTRYSTRNLFTEAELDLLRAIAADDGAQAGGAFAVDLGQPNSPAGIDLGLRPDLRFQWG